MKNSRDIPETNSPLVLDKRVPIGLDYNLEFKNYPGKRPQTVSKEKKENNERS